MKSRKIDKSIIAIIGLEILLVVSGAALGWFGRQFYDREYQALPLLNESRQILLTNALKDPPAEPALEYGMIRGMLQAFNEPYTLFVEPTQHKLQTNQLEGKFGGIGARIERNQQNYLLLYPYPDSAASLAGIIEGERLLSVDMLEIGPQTSLDTILSTIRGPVGEKVTLKIAPPSDYTQVRTVIVTRQEVALPSVSWNLAPDQTDIGMIQINLLAATTPSEIEKAIKSLTERKATRLIIDLRNNSGGLVEAGVDSARLFLREGVIIEEKYRDRSVKTYRIDKPGAYTTLPLVIIVNRGTASAAEIMAGSLQANKRALLVGTQTFGKDSIQLIFKLKDGSSLHVTAARWWIPGLPLFNSGHGLQPDVILSEEQANSSAAVQTAAQALMK